MKIALILSFSCYQEKLCVTLCIKLMLEADFDFKIYIHLVPLFLTCAKNLFKALG